MSTKRVLNVGGGSKLTLLPPQYHGFAQIRAPDPQTRENFKLPPG
jgi:hypothetical protein